MIILTGILTHQALLIQQLLMQKSIFSGLVFLLKGCCTVFQLALKSLEITVSVLSERMSKTGRKNTKGLKSYKEFKF